VIGYGTDELPAFYSRRSGLPVDVRLDTPAQVAGVIRARRVLELSSGLLVTVPVPAEEALDKATAEQAIARAAREADERGIHGPEATPWLLSRVVELTEGASLRANTALLINNARTAAGIARALASD
jgi:pseudouridine-5'-phosphate glycosidase